jgi:uncharacterized SAM-binding protein YcdF (DUF218 family)
MFTRLVALLALLWLLSFAWFAMFLPQPAGKARTEAAVVFTGGTGRVARGLAAIDRKQAPILLVSGVDQEVKPGEFRAEFGLSETRMQCCVTLGYESYDTRSNAAETARWLARHDAGSVRLITSDWHMRRAALELERLMPPGFVIVRDAVTTKPSFPVLLEEFHKFAARRVMTELQD